MMIYLEWPRWARRLRTRVDCILYGHTEDFLGVRKHTGILAMLVSEGMNVYRCNHCGAYRETPVPSVFTVGSKIVWNEVNVKEDSVQADNL